MPIHIPVKDAPLDGERSDGFHTFNELYEYRLLYNAALFNLMHKAGGAYGVHKSKKHFEGDLCFDGNWFIVMAYIPQPGGGLIQISNHYHISEWDTFKIPERDKADQWDGHTPKDVAERLRKWLEA